MANFLVKIYNHIVCPHQEELDQKFDELEQAIDDIIKQHAKTEETISGIAKKKAEVAKPNGSQQPLASSGH